MRPGKIVAVGKNYLDHVREMGGSVPSVEPILFMKPPSAVIADGESIMLPSRSDRVEFEGELVAVIGTSVSNAPSEEAALAAVRGYCAGNDVTARDLQAIDGQWTRAKGFDTFCPLGPMVTGIDASDLAIATRVNGAVHQQSRTSQMLRSVGELIVFISAVMTLEEGDAIFTGTPAGVGPLNDGDVVEVEIENVGTLRNPVRRQ